MKTITVLCAVIVLSGLVAGCTTNMTGLRDLSVPRNLLEQAVNNLNQGNVLQYKALVRQAAGEFPDDPFVLANMGAIAQMEGDPVQAEAYYERALERAYLERVTVSNKRDAEGRLLKDVLEENLKLARAEKSETHEAFHGLAVRDVHASSEKPADENTK